MSGVLVLAAPEVLASVATEVAGIDSSLRAANAAATIPTTAVVVVVVVVVAAAGDEVSAAIASLFSGHAQAYQALSAQEAAFHSQFVHALNGAAGGYAAAEAANAAPLQTAAQDLAAFSPVKDLTGRPLFGNGANGAAGTGQAGGNGAIGGDSVGAGGSGDGYEGAGVGSAGQSI
jgi:hypothetical protein